MRCYRFLARIWRVFGKIRKDLPQPGTEAPPGVSKGEALDLRRKTHQTIRRVTDDLGPRMHLNTAVAAQMELINAIAPLAERVADEGVRWVLREAFSVLSRLLAPFAPHVAEELWEALGETGFVSDAAWPSYDEGMLVEDRVTVVVQVNGKLRARLELARDLSRDGALEQARAHENVAGHLEGKTIRRVVFVPNRLLNLVVQ